MCRGKVGTCEVPVEMRSLSVSGFEESELEVEREESSPGGPSCWIVVEVVLLLPFFLDFSSAGTLKRSK